MTRWLQPLFLVLALPALAYGMNIPGFTRSVPEDHFLGISAPSSSLDEARASAVLDVKRQILGAISGQFSATEAFSVSGSPQRPSYQVRGQVQGDSSGTVFGVENRIVDQAYTQDGQGRFIYFILVRFPESRIAEMARLSRGARVVAQLVSIDDGYVYVRLEEINGVRAVMDMVRITMEWKHRFADTISYYVTHVPSESKSENEISIGRTVLQGGYVEFGFPIPELDEPFADLFLGREGIGHLIFSGTDELGRPVSAGLIFNP